MTKRQKFQFFTDPGHGWLRVPLETVDALGVKPSKFSYRNTQWAYLEEDCDVTLFMVAWHDAHGCLPTLVHREPSNVDSPIRRYKRFSGEGFSRETMTAAAGRVSEILGGAQ